MRWVEFTVRGLYIKLFAGREELDLTKEWGIMLVYYGLWMLYLSLGTWATGIIWGRTEEEKGDVP